MSGVPESQQDEEIQASLHKLERENRILRKKLARCEANHKTLEEAKDQYDTVFQSVIRELDEQKELLGQKNQELEILSAKLSIQKERMETELNVGREIQMSMIPLTFPAFPDHDEFAIYAALEPAREVGGDFYDYFFIGEEKFLVCIGDVSGKGVPSALFMAVAKTLIKSRAADDLSTTSIITHVNGELSADNKENMFVTLFIGIVNLKTGEVVFTNAGHNPPFVLRKDGTLLRLDERHGPVLGAMEGMVYGQDRIKLAPSDILFLYTDGVTEAMNAENTLFSDERLAGLLEGMDGVTAEKAVKDTVASVKAFEGEADQTDDITVLAFQYHGGFEA